MKRLGSLSLVFAGLGLLAVGGGTAVLPEMQHTMRQLGWLTDKQFIDIYSLGQVAPGPNMLMVMVIGYRLAGWAGAGAVGTSFFLPDCLLTLGVNRIWHRLKDSPWRLAIQRGMAPVAIGLVLSGTYAIARLSLRDPISLGIAITVAAILSWRHVNPGVLVLAGGAFYLLLHR